MNQPKVFLLDLDDATLQDSEKVIHRPTWEELLPPGLDGLPEGLVGVGMKPISVIKAIADYRGISSMIPDDTGAIRPRDAVLEEKRRQIVLGRVRDPHVRIEPYPGLPEFLEECSKNHIPVTMVTSGFLEYAVEATQRMGIQDKIAWYVSGGLTEEPKPNGEPFTLAAHINMLNRKMDIHPHQMVMIGDSPKSDMGAKQFGLKTIGVRTPFNSEDGLYKQGADLVISDYRQLDLGPNGPFAREPFLNGHREGIPIEEAYPDYGWSSVMNRGRR